ncbi:unnamed protein product [Sphacelaria rigidula]
MMKLERYNLTLPISASTIHSWVTKLGCTYERHSQSYYTDGHERPDVVESRNEYIKQKRGIALRQPLWVHVEKSSLSEQELAKFEVLKGTGDETDDAEVYECEIIDKAVCRPKAASASCKAHHSKEVCKCDRKMYYIGQDVSIYKVYAREGNEWVIQGVRDLRKKTEGAGEMISAFQDEMRGLGLSLTKDELERVNKFREERGRPALQRTPGSRHLVFGKNKGGYWGFEQFEKHVVDAMDVLEVIEPEKQIVFEVDHSAGHAKMREDGLHTSSMNVKYGGRQKVLRDTTMTEGCLGSAQATMYKLGETWSTEYRVGATPHPKKLKVGDTKCMTFKSGDPPPFYDVDAPEVNTKMVRKKTPKKKDSAPVPEGKGTEGATSSTEETEEYIKEGYIGKAKGIKQVLWERGLWLDQMGTGDKVRPDKNIVTVLGKLPDFRDERSVLQHTVESRGHLLVLSPKCHPEVAGVGIE